MKKKVRYQVAGAVGLVPVAMGMALPATAQAATNVPAQPSSGKTVLHHRGFTSCTGIFSAGFPTEPSHNLEGGIFFFRISPDLCVGTAKPKFKWNKSFSKRVSTNVKWSSSFRAETSPILFNTTVHHAIGTFTVSLPMHLGFTPASLMTVCATSQFAGGHTVCDGCTGGAHASCHQFGT